MLGKSGTRGLIAISVLGWLGLPACGAGGASDTSHSDAGTGGASTGGALGSTATGGSTSTGGTKGSAGGGAVGAGGNASGGSGVGGSSDGGAGASGLANGGSDAGGGVDASTDAGQLGTGGAPGSGGASSGGVPGSGGSNTGGASSGGLTGSGGATLTPLTVVSTLPSGSATDVAPDAALGATFSSPLNAATVGGTSFVVKSGVSAIGGTASVVGADLLFGPTRPLEPGTAYTATLGVGTASSAGAHLAAPFSWSFTTRRWGIAAPIDLVTDTGGSGPQVGVDSKGNAIVAWLQIDASAYTVWANRYDSASATWGTAKRLDSADFGPASQPRLAVDKDGNAFVVWQEPAAAAAPNSVWAARYSPSGVGAGWAAAALVETDDTGEAISPVVGFDGAGNAITLWNQKDGTGVYNLWSSRALAGAAWGARVRVETNHVGNGSSFDLGVDTAGNALALWTMNKGAGIQVYASRYVPGSPWTAAVGIQSNTQLADRPQIAVDSAGNAVAAWSQTDGTHYNIWGARYSALSGWQTAVNIQSKPLSDSYGAQVATDSKGNAIVMWPQSGATDAGVWANASLVANAGWSGAVNVSVTGNGPAIAISPGGRAASALQNGGIFANAGPVDATAGTGWGAALNVQTVTAQAGGPRTAVDDAGDAFVVWIQASGANWRVWANRFR